MCEGASPIVNCTRASSYYIITSNVYNTNDWPGEEDAGVHGDEVDDDPTLSNNNKTSVRHH